ncbi:MULTISPECIES: hypothetical protein [Methylomonas]|uniref:hypothetical protein n=1 Tax=Methylomonas TaxID=416 RepID=UPI001231A4DB|nr:hypothetical protein [Methylomonas rhizoryzae]
MRHLIYLSLAAAFSAAAVTVYAEPPSITVPDNVVANIMKRHPGAGNLRGINETHFGQPLLEVSFKDQEGVEILELFNAKGHLVTNEYKVANLGEVSPEAMAALKQAFPEFELQHAELIGNPNGAGQEYEVYLRANGVNWRVALNDKGILLDKRQTD